MEKPNFCVIEVSHRCNFNCKMCACWRNENNTIEVMNKDLFKFMSSLKDFVENPIEMNFTGGEPLLRKGIFDLIKFGVLQGFHLSMTTNAYLINEAMARELADSGIEGIPISLDSLNGEIHDYIRGIKGSFKKALEAIEYFIRHKGKLPNLNIQTVIMEPNLDGILDLAHWAQEKRILIKFMALTPPDGKLIDHPWYEKKDFSFLWPKDKTKVDFIIDRLIEFKKTGYTIDNPIGQLERFKLYFKDPLEFVKPDFCVLGDNFLHINYRGDIYLCHNMNPIGNIKEDSISKVWISEKAEIIRKKMLNCRRNCIDMINCYIEEFKTRSHKI